MRLFGCVPVDDPCSDYWGRIGETQNDLKNTLILDRSSLYAIEQGRSVIWIGFESKNMQNIRIL